MTLLQVTSSSVLTAAMACFLAASNAFLASVVRLGAFRT